MLLRIRDLREDNDYNQSELAELLHVKQSTYSRYESGAFDIPHSALCILADFYQASVDYLLGRANIPTPYPKK